MNPRVDFHGINRIELKKVQTFERGVGHPAFSTCAIKFTDKDGESFTMSLFADTSEQLDVHIEGSAHSLNELLKVKEAAQALTDQEESLEAAGVHPGPERTELEEALKK